jgi:hypothetical protein
LSSAPEAPDPYATAAAQTQSNKDTASYNAALNRTSQYTPYGNSVYSQTGTDSTGASTWRNDITLTPEAQQQLDNQLRQNNQLSQLGDTLAGQAKTQIDTPYSDQAQSAQAASDAYYAKQKAYLDPQWNQQESNLNTRLANQGVMQGANAYERAQGDFNRDKNFAYSTAQDGAIQLGQQQQAIALQNQSALKNAPLNQLNALRTGTQIQNPQFTTAPSATAAGTDIAGDIYKSNQIAAANANNFNNGLFSLGSSAAMAFSDRRLKRDIRRVGETPVMKLPLYAFRYLWDDVLRVGVMSDEAPQGAVTRHSTGFDMVNYSALA